MGLIIALVVVLAIVGITSLGVQLGLTGVFGVGLPYFAIAIFVIGVIYRILNWAKVPVPFRIPTTCGQEKSLDFIKTNPIDNPTSKLAVIVRMFLEITVFRSLFRNSKAELTEDGRIVYQWEKWLWIFALLFHWGMFFVIMRHMRFFAGEVPAIVRTLEKIDGVMLIDLHPIYLTGFFMLFGLIGLLLRRLLLPKVRYISLLNDYFPLVLLLAIVCSGMLMRYLTRVDVSNIRELIISLYTFQPHAPEVGAIATIFYIHLALVCTLLIYFPMGKLMHAFGVFMSPTRNMVNNSRKVHHTNPWNYPVEVHTYEEYEDEYRDKMAAVGLPLDKSVEQAQADAEKGIHAKHGVMSDV